MKTISTSRSVFLQIIKFICDLQTRAENTVREQKIRIDSLTAEQQRILAENAQSREVKEEMNRQNKK